MNDQVFDADAFMSATVDEPMATAMQSLPDGEYTAVIGELTSENLSSVTIGQGPNAGQERKVLRVPFIVKDQEINTKLERETIVHNESYWLDFDDNGKLATGADKNVRLGQLRAALNQNVPGWSPLHLSNAGPVKISIKTTSDKRDSEKKYTNINRIAALR